MTILFTLVNFLVIAFVARVMWKKLATADTLIFWSALILKLAAGVSIGLVYMYYYTDVGDTFTFFQDSIHLANGEPSMITTEPRSRFFVTILSVVNIITFNNYWVTSLWLSLYSFVCCYWLVTKLDVVMPSLRMASRIALLFTPSVVFWTSGIIKECVAFGAVAIIVVHFLSFMRGEKLTWLKAISLIVFMYLLLNLKYYWGAVLLTSLLSGLVVHWTVEKRINDPWKLVASWLAVFFVFAFVASFTHPNFWPSRFLQVLVENHDIYIVRSAPEKLIHYHNLTPDWASVIINSPWALFSGLFRPVIFEAQPPFGYLAGLENLLLLVIVLWKLRYIRMPLQENRVVVFTAVMYVVVLCIFLALSTPNFGTLSRFRTGFLPFFVLLILADHPILNFINGKPSHHIRS